MSFKVKQTAGGSRNYSVEISGFLRKPEHEGKRFLLTDFSVSEVKLTAIIFFIQEKAGLFLWWDADKESLILPLEGRGFFKFDNGIKHEPGWKAQIWASAFGLNEPKGFTLLMDFDR